MPALHIFGQHFVNLLRNENKINGLIRSKDQILDLRTSKIKNWVHYRSKLILEARFRQNQFFKLISVENLKLRLIEIILSQKLKLKLLGSKIWIWGYPNSQVIIKTKNHDSRALLVKNLSKLIGTKITYSL